MQKQDSKLLYPELTEKIIWCLYDVYNEIGQGFLESVYSNCMQNSAYSGWSCCPNVRFLSQSCFATMTWANFELIFWLRN